MKIHSSRIMMEELTSQATQECAWSYVTKLTLSFMLYDKKEICIQARKILKTSSKYHTSKASEDKKLRIQNVHMNEVHNNHEH